MATEIMNLPLFPIGIGVYNLGEVHHEHDVRLVEAIFNEKNSHQGITSSQVGGWHSENLRHKNPAFDEMCELVSQYSHQYCEAFGLQPVDCLDCWANVNQRGDYNMPHHHNGNGLAAVYYPCNHHGNYTYISGNPLKAGAHSGKGGELVFQSPHYGMTGHIPSKGISPFNITHYHVEPTAGILLIFPAYLIHSVLPTRDDNLRISLAFSYA